MSEPTRTSSSAEESHRLRKLASPVLLWFYGISITVLLVSIWGRAVATDTSLLASAASKVGESELVMARVESWFDRVLIGAGMEEGDSDHLAGVVVALPEVRQSTARLVGEVVEAAAEPTAGPIVVDVAEIYRPAAPAVATALSDAGVSVGESQVAAMIDSLDPLVLGTGEGRPSLGHGSSPARTLYVATVLALVVMLTSGGAVVYLAEDRRKTIRTLLTRLAVSSFTFAVFFRLSSWVVDPSGGRAGVRGALAQVVGSKLWIPLLLAIGAGASAAAVRQRLRPRDDPKQA